MARGLLVASGFAGILAALHCGSNADNSEFGDVVKPCLTVYAGKCGTACATDVDCADGLYCSGAGPDMKCTADCVAGDACSGGTCSPRGRCGLVDPPISFPPGDAGADGDARIDAVCADTDVSLTKVVPKVLFLLDQSSSMLYNKFPSGPSNNCMPDCRWTVLKDVLIGPAGTPGGVVKTLEGEAELAVQLYSATDPTLGDGDDSQLTGAVDNVCPRFNGKAFAGTTFALNNFAAINALLRPAGVDDDTPTGPAIAKVAGIGPDGGVNDPKGLAALTTTAPKVIVLVTDGEPGLCGDNSPSDPGRAAVVTAAQQAFGQSIKTFVIAIGDTTPQAQAHFKAVANAGQGQNPATGDAGAILPSTPTQLVDALEKIVLDARTCTFVLNGKVQAGSEAQGTVTLDGKTLPYNTPDGWKLKDPSTLELVGAACTELKTTANPKLSARFPCGTVTPNNPK